MTAGSTTIDYFDRMYQEPDPWGYESSPYEQRKYAVTVASLPQPRYRRAFEPGCSIGVLSALLADRTDELVAVDFHPASLERARARLVDRRGAHTEVLDIPRQWPSGTFDLIVLSEVAYYLDEGHHRLLVARVEQTLEPGGDVVLVHWRGETDYPQTGDAVHEVWAEEPAFTSVVSHLEIEFRLDVLRRAPGRPATAR